MRMFLSVSGHSKELTANSSAPTLYQTDLRITNHRRQKSPSSFALLSIHSKLESNGLYVDRNHKFSEGTFSTLAIFKATSKLLGS